MTPFSARREALMADLRRLPDPRARLELLMERARAAPRLPVEFRTDDHLVEGCMSSLWFIPSFQDGRCYFRCDADSLVVKSVASLLCDLYSDAAPEDILANDPSFLRDAGITQHLTSNRRDALTRVWHVIREFARTKTE